METPAGYPMGACVALTTTPLGGLCYEPALSFLGLNAEACRALRSTLKVQQTLHRVAPNFLDAIFHLCRSFPPADGPVYSSYKQPRIAEDLEVGNSYLKERNYRGAEFRFEDALAYQPDNPEAAFKLAEALAKLGRKNEALGAYTRYLQIAPDGVFAKRARKEQIQLENRKPR